MRLIDADALKEHKFVGVQTDELDEVPIKAYQQGWNDAIDAIIDNDPTVERPKGEWIVVSNGTTNHYACSKCGHAGDFQDKFCRECGADMRKEAEND